MTTTTDLERDLALRLRIEALMADYAHCIDEDRLEEWPDFFTEDGRYRVTSRENHESDGKEHRTQSNFTIIRTMSEGDMSVFACGKYIDHIVENGDRLKYRERSVILESRRINTLLVIPI
jgi:anthranilate 1,2-dioxygenase small subunit